MDLQLHDNKYRFRSIWISDTHLGTKHCHAESLLEFLTVTDSEYLYLVGDIVDLWAMKKNIHWPSEHTRILRLIQDKADKGTKVIYTPGNHDNALRLFCGKRIGNIRVEAHAKHNTLDGRQLLVLHGDQIDSLMHAHCGPLLNYLGDVGYDFLLFINRHLGRVQRALGMKYWSLATLIKNNLKNAMKHVATYEHVLSGFARDFKVNGVICGHIHFPRLQTFQGIDYFNTGDWVEHCTALVETASGEINLLHWSEMLDVIHQDKLLNESIAA